MMSAPGRINMISDMTKIIDTRTFSEPHADLSNLSVPAMQCDAIIMHLSETHGLQRRITGKRPEINHAV